MEVCDMTQIQNVIENSDNDRDLGKLISSEITKFGFLTALADIFFMSVYLLGSLAALSLFTRYYLINDYAMGWMCAAISIFLICVWMRLFFRIIRPDGNYEYIRTFILPNNKKVTMKSIRVYDGMLEDYNE
jgi:hypothetical protein